MNRVLLAGAAVAALIAFVLANSLYIVDQVSQAVVLQFGDPVALISEPGLKFKTPFIQTVVVFDKRVLDYEPPGEEVIGSDQKRIADLPAENSDAIYARMQSERGREAKQFRAEGYEMAQGIKAQADLERTVILAKAARQAQISRGEGDAQSIGIYAKAFGQDPSFYAFYRSLQAYRTTLGNSSTFVLTPENPFLKYLSPTARPDRDQ